VLLVFALVFAVPGLVLYRRMPRAASHLRLAAEPLHPPRGGSVRTTLAIADAARVEDPVEVGVVCTGLYDVILGADPPYGSRRETLQAVVYEHWEKANRSLPSQTIAFTIPRAAPYSYEGRYVSFLWRVRARDASSRITEESLWVEP
jgi:hypothetical protein